MSDPLRFGYYLSIAIGGLMAGLCGLCTGNVILSPGSAMLAPIALVVGGAPVAIGLWLIFYGVKGLKSGRDE